MQQGKGGDDDMARMTTGFMVLALFLGLLSAPAIAQQPAMSDCQKWVSRINDEAGNRLDEASYSARMKVGEIAKMCQQGKTAEAEKAAKDTMAMLGIKP
jgi:hypothetical protein